MKNVPLNTEKKTNASNCTVTLHVTMLIVCDTVTFVLIRPT
jgi:hypothetical protein